MAKNFHAAWDILFNTHIILADNRINSNDKEQPVGGVSYLTALIWEDAICYFLGGCVIFALLRLFHLAFTAERRHVDELGRVRAEHAAVVSSWGGSLKI